MKYRKGLLVKSIVILVLLLIIYVIYALLPLLGSIGEFLARALYPFVLSVILYYLLRPIVRGLEKVTSAYVAITLTFCFLAAFFTYVIVFIYPEVVKQINLLIKLPNSDLLKWPGGVVNVFGHSIYISEEIRNFITNFIFGINTFLMKNMVSIMGWVTEFVAGLIVVPFVLFYLLKDDELMYEKLSEQIPEKYIEDFNEFSKELDFTFMHFINGRLLVSACVSAILLIAFLIIGINYPILLFLCSLIFFIIPTLGSFIATIPPLLVGFSMSNTMGLEVLLLMIVVSTLEGVWIAPKIMGSTLYMHPLTVVAVLWVAGLLYGIVGLVLAIPVYALIKILFKYASKFIY